MKNKGIKPTKQQNVSQNGPKLDEPGRVAQSVTYLITDTRLTVDPGVMISITSRSILW